MPIQRNGNVHSETTTEVGSDGHTTEVTKIVNEYDRENRRSARIDATDPSHPLVTSYAYDLQGNIKAVTDQEGRSMRCANAFAKNSNLYSVPPRWMRSSRARCR